MAFYNFISLPCAVFSSPLIIMLRQTFMSENGNTIIESGRVCIIDDDDSWRFFHTTFLFHFYKCHKVNGGWKQRANGHSGNKLTFYRTMMKWNLKVSNWRRGKNRSFSTLQREKKDWFNVMTWKSWRQWWWWWLCDNMRIRCWVKVNCTSNA